MGPTWALRCQNSSVVVPDVEKIQVQFGPCTVSLHVLNLYYTAAEPMHAPGRWSRARAWAATWGAQMPCTHLNHMHVGGGDRELLGWGVLHLDELLVDADHHQLLLCPHVVATERAIDEECVIVACPPTCCRSNNPDDTDYALVDWHEPVSNAHEMPTTGAEQKQSKCCKRIIRKTTT